MSATVPSPWLVSLGVRCCFRFGPQSRAENAVRKARTGSQNGIKHVPGIPNKGSQNGQHVTKIGTRRPRWGQQCVPKRPKGGQNRDKRAKMGPESPRPGRRATLVRERGVSAMKGDVVFGGQKGPKLIKKTIKQCLFFGTPPCFDFDPMLLQNWCQNRARLAPTSSQKRSSASKRVLQLNIIKTC